MNDHDHIPPSPTTDPDADINDLLYNFGCADCGVRLRQASDLHPDGRVPVARIVGKLDECFAHNDMDGAGRLLDYWCREAVTLRDREGELSLVSEQLGYYRKVNDAEHGLSAVARSLTLLRELDMDTQVSAGTILLNAATTLKAFGRASTAMELYAKVENIYRAALPPTDPLFAGLCNNRAVTLCDLGRYPEAEKDFRQALEILRAVGGREADCAVTYANMAHMYAGWLGPDSDEGILLAEDCLGKAQAILESDALPHDGYYAYVCDKCAPAYDHFGFFLYAAELKERAKVIYEGT